MVHPLTDIEERVCSTQVNMSEKILSYTKEVHKCVTAKYLDIVAHELPQNNCYSLHKLQSRAHKNGRLE